MECVCTMEPIFAQFLYNTACVWVSEEGLKFPSTVLPSKSTITIFSGSNCSYGTPVGLIAKTALFLSATLRLPKLNNTSPKAGSCLFATQASSRIWWNWLMDFAINYFQQR